MVLAKRRNVFSCDDRGGEGILMCHRTWGGREDYSSANVNRLTAKRLLVPRVNVHVVSVAV